MSGKIILGDTVTFDLIENAARIREDRQMAIRLSNCELIQKNGNLATIKKGIDHTKISHGIGSGWGVHFRWKHIRLGKRRDSEEGLAGIQGGARGHLWRIIKQAGIKRIYLLPSIVPTPREILQHEGRWRQVCKLTSIMKNLDETEILERSGRMLREKEQQEEQAGGHSGTHFTRIRMEERQSMRRIRQNWKEDILEELLGGCRQRARGTQMGGCFKIWQV